MNLTVKQEGVQKRALTGKDALNRPMANTIKEPSADELAMRTRSLEPMRYGQALQRKIGRL